MHYFINFKNYKYAEIDLFSALSLLIGKNGSGKSNLIEGVELLAYVAAGKPLHELVDSPSSLSRPDGVRGGIHSCVKFGEKNFTLGFKANIEFMGKNQAFDYQIVISVDPFPRVISEHLFVGKRKLFLAMSEERSKDGLLTVRFDNFARGGTKPHKSMYGDRSVISRYEELISENSSGDKGNKLDAVRTIGAIKKHLQSSFVIDPSPKSMRNYVRIGQDSLLKDGSNISAVLDGLETFVKDGKASLENILKVVRQIPEEPFLKFDFARTVQNDVLFGIKLGERLVDARLISDGTLRIIAVVTALETISEKSRVVIEEFDNGLHPSRAHVLINAIKEIVTRRKLNVMLTTHNPASLNSLDGVWLKNVHVCYWDADEDTSKLVSLLKIPKVDYLLESASGLGDIVTKSIFDKHLKPGFEDNKKAEALSWLEQLK